MTTTIFGGQKGDKFKDYLYSLRQAIAVQLEKQIESGATEEDAKKEVRAKFVIDKLKFDISNGVVTDTHSDRYENVPANGGGTREACMKRYSYSIPFFGDNTAVKYRPKTFHGFDKTADVSSNYSTKQNHLIVVFRSEMNNQAQFDHFKSESIGELSANCNEINKEIDDWNNNQLDAAIAEVYPKVLAHVNQTKDFIKNNNIKK